LWWNGFSVKVLCAKEISGENYLIIFEKKLKVKKVFLIILFFSFYSGFSQYNSNATWLLNDSFPERGKADISHLVSIFDQYLESRDRNKKGSSYKPFVRWEYH
jgi:hypothetical protein